jgi:hypothetical protein
VAKQPELKFCAVSVEKVPLPVNAVKVGSGMAP